MLIELASELIPALQILPNKVQINKWEEDGTLISVYKDVKGVCWVQMKHRSTKEWSSKVKMKI